MARITTSDIQGRSIASNGITENVLFSGINYPLFAHNKNFAACSSDGIKSDENNPKKRVPAERIQMGANMEEGASLETVSQAPSFPGWKNM
jgi:hypothetical protein